MSFQGQKGQIWTFVIYIRTNISMISEMQHVMTIVSMKYIYEVMYDFLAYLMTFLTLGHLTLDDV